MTLIKACSINTKGELVQVNGSSLKKTKTWIAVSLLLFSFGCEEPTGSAGCISSRCLRSASSRGEWRACRSRSRSCSIWRWTPPRLTTDERLCGCSCCRRRRRCRIRTLPCGERAFQHHFKNNTGSVFGFSCSFSIL